MHIGRSEGVEPPGLPDSAGNLQKMNAAGVPSKKHAPAGEAVDPQVAAYTSIAAASGEIDQDAVREARALIASGKLDTPEAIQRTAEAILKLGI
jgi:hypothetical protein